MKTIVLLCALVACAVAAPQFQPQRYQAQLQPQQKQVQPQTQQYQAQPQAQQYQAQPQTQQYQAQLQPQQKQVQPQTQQYQAQPQAQQKQVQPQTQQYQAQLQPQQKQVQPQTQQYQAQPQAQQYQPQAAVRRQQPYSLSAGSTPTVNIALTRSSPEEPIVIIRQVQDFSLPGTYSFSYETENAIQASEFGELKNAGTQDEANSVQGSYSWTGPDGVQYTVNYVADENGFQAQGAHLPVPPPVPEEIQRAIDYARSQPGFREDDDGQYRKE